MAPPGAPGQRPALDVVLSAESVDVEVRRAPRERVLVRREVVTEEVTVVVPVRREVLRVEREPLGPVEAHAGEQDAGEPLPLEVVLSEERPVVHLEVVAYERVRVGVRAVPGSASVGVERRREVAEVTEATGGPLPTTSSAEDARSTP